MLKVLVLCRRRGGALHQKALLTWPVDHDFSGGGGLVFGVPSLSSSPTTIMTGWSSRGCISCWVQRASFPRSWPVFVPSAPLHSPALCDSVRPGWVIKKARAQVVIIRDLSSMGSKKRPTTRKVTSAPFFLPLFSPPPPSCTMLL